MGAFDRKLAWRTPSLGLAVTLAFAAAAHAQATYPKSRSLADVSAWILSDTPLQLAQVVDVGPSAVTAITSAAPTGDPRGFLANIASEAIDPSIGKQEEILSWKIPVEIDCDRRAVRLGDMTGFPNRDLKTGPRVVRQADTQWVQPSSTAPLGAVMRSMCDRDFKRPFAAASSKVASVKPEKAKPAPRPGPPPEVVALKPPTKPQPLTEAAEANTAGKSGAVTKAAPAKTEAAKAESKPETTVAAPVRPIGHGASPYVVQVGAAPGPDEAKVLLSRVLKKFSGELSGFKTDVVMATVDGKTVYRAQVSGLGGVRDAEALCSQLKAGGQACFVRK